MQQYYESQGRVWQGGSVGHSQIGVSGVQGGSGPGGGLQQQGQVGANVTQVNPDGTWVDAQGTLRQSDGTPVIRDSDIIGWQRETPDEAEIIYDAWDFRPNIPNLGGE
jgi:hypothetical protein